MTAVQIGCNAMWCAVLNRGRAGVGRGGGGGGGTDSRPTSVCTTVQVVPFIPHKFAVLQYPTSTMHVHIVAQKFRLQSLDCNACPCAGQQQV